MQAYLRDLSQQHANSASFVICQRIIHECHEIIFGDLPSTPYSFLSLPGQIWTSRRMVRPHTQPALVGIGMVLAGAPGMPDLTQIMGPVAIEQGRVDEQGQDVRSIERHEDDGAMVRTISSNSAAESLEDDNDSVGGSPVPGEEQMTRNTTDGSMSSRPISAIPGRLSRRQTIAAQTSPALPLHLRDARKPRLSEDPFGQEDVPPPTSATAPSPFQSTPSFPSRHPYRPNSLPTADILLQKYDFASQMHLLRGHYCRSEVRQLYAISSTVSNSIHRFNSYLLWRISATSFWSSLNQPVSVPYEPNSPDLTICYLPR